MVRIEAVSSQPRTPSCSGDPEHCERCAVRPLTICAALRDHELHLLSRVMTKRKFAAAEVMFDEGDAADSVYNITSGAVKTYKLLPDGRRQITGFLFEGDFLGLTGPGRPSFAFSAETVTAVEACRFDRRRLDDLLSRHHELEHRLLGVASNELATVQDQMLLLGRKTAKERLASFFLQLSRRAAGRGEPEDPIALPMSRSDIADYLGLTTETVSRTITQLKTTGVISLMPENRVSISDMAALAELADGF